MDVAQGQICEILVSRKLSVIGLDITYRILVTVHPVNSASSSLMLSDAMYWKEKKVN